MIQRFSVPTGFAAGGALFGGLIGFAGSRLWWIGLLVAVLTGLICYFTGTRLLKQFNLASGTTTAEFKRFLNDGNAPNP
jgi:phosphotransferase system  glucose/maltose/N-acetylglucosamine-specific IIC component